MLYVTTRDNSNPSTAYRTLKTNRGQDGGFYVPFRHPNFSKENLESILDEPFTQCIADVLNNLFNCNLSGWDIAFYCGRNPVRFHSTEHKVLIAEAWHTTDNRFDSLAETVIERISGESYPVSDWVNIAVRAAVWFGIFGELKKQGIHSADVSLVSGDFTLPISAWYARRWGLPIKTIICCCNENNTVWELLSHGQMRTDAVSIHTILPDADVTIPVAIERLVYEAGGIAEATSFAEACRRGRFYTPGDSILSKLRDGLYPVVVSSQRLESIISGIYKTNGYLMSPAAALAYAGFRDYKATTGQTRTAVVWAEEPPQYSLK